MKQVGHLKFRLGLLGACALLATAYAATRLAVGPSVKVSTGTSTSTTSKARVAHLAYQDGEQFRKAMVVTYLEGQAGHANVYVRSSLDNGATWSEPILISRDGAGAPTGGQSVQTLDGRTLLADNNKATLVAPPTTSGPKLLMSWTSSYCPQDPQAQIAGTYASNLQGSTDHPYYCVWAASTTDPALQQWQVQQITRGERDAINDVVVANNTGTAYALTWQEDPAGLQPGEAEGPGDGGSGANVSGGTNIWYSHATSPDLMALREKVQVLSDNHTAGTGQPGASRPSLQLSGNTAALAYEESACPGATKGKCVVYHSFGYAQPEVDAPGTVVSDVSRHARRPRLVLQGATAAGRAQLRTLLLWRESAVVTPGAPADVVLRRGLANGEARPGSTGFLASDLLADLPQTLTQLADRGGNANAHRAVLRGAFVGLAYDQTSNMDAANPDKTATPSAFYELMFARSGAEGAPGSWSTPRQLSNAGLASVNVEEPRLVATLGTLTNPITGQAEAGDTQDPQVLYVAYATATNEPKPRAQRMWVSRSIDQGQSFEAFSPVSELSAGQSEAQLRPSPDGKSASVLWLQDRTTEDASSVSTDVLLATAVPTEVPDATVVTTSASLGGGCTIQPGAAFDPALVALPALALVALRRRRRNRLRQGS